MVTVLLVLSWVMYVVCFGFAFFWPMQVTELAIRAMKREYLPLIAIIWVLGIVAQVVMCIHYGVWRVLGIQALLGVLCGIHSYNVSVVRSIEE